MAECRHRGGDEDQQAPEEHSPDDVMGCARLLEQHGVAAPACRDGVVVWANRVALDLMDRQRSDMPDADVLALWAERFVLPDEALQWGRARRRW